MNDDISFKFNGEYYILPEWAKYVSIDRYGLMSYFSNKPSFKEVGDGSEYSSGWVHNSGKWRIACNTDFLGDSKLYILNENNELEIFQVITIDTTGVISEYIPSVEEYFNSEEFNNLTCDSSENFYSAIASQDSYHYWRNKK